MKAMIFAAGKGTRLLPLTKDKPKALVEIAGLPMIECQIKKLISFGYNDIIINVSHFATQIIDYIKSRNNFDVRISYSTEEDELLETGGGLKKASWFFDDNQPFLLHNVDPLCSINLRDLYNYHLKNKPLVTLAVKDRPTSRYLIFNSKNILCGWEYPDQNKIIQIKDFTGDEYKIAFSCIHIVEPKMLSLIEEEGAFSLTNLYLRLAEKHNIIAYKHNQDSWFDMGTPEKLRIAEDFYLKNNKGI